MPPARAPPAAPPSRAPPALPAKPAFVQQQAPIKMPPALPPKPQHVAQAQRDPNGDLAMDNVKTFLPGMCGVAVGYGVGGRYGVGGGFKTMGDEWSFEVKTQGGVRKV